jgi:hypothetical protein
LWLYVLQVLPTGVAGISTLATPVIGIVSAAVVLGERVSKMEAVGMACILAALLVLMLQGLPLRRSPKGPKAAVADAGRPDRSPALSEGDRQPASPGGRPDPPDRMPRVPY